MTSPLITVIVPVYNVQAHVAACIDSLKAQTLTDFQAIVVDDGSTDDSATVAAQAIDGDLRFQLVQQDNRGLSGARNTGLDLAQGQFIAFLDSDDRFAPGFLRQMWQALDETGADWVACGIRFSLPDGPGAAHSAIHGQAAQHSSGRITRFALTGWNDAIRHFPSAWNKLYRRSLIDGLRFPEGTWFEDHGFFYRAAARTDHILHLAEPLYLQTRGRDGQITGTDSDRVFEQFAVLDDMRALMVTPDRPDGAQAFQNIASRLLFERSTALRDPVRRARYAQACADYLAEHGLTYCPEWDPHISRAWGLEIQGILPLSIVIPWSGHAPDLLAASLTALAQQGAPGREILIICDDETAADQAQKQALFHPNARVFVQSGRGVGSARNTGLEAAQGRYILFLDAGDRMAEMALHDWVDGMISQQADFTVSAFRQGIGQGDTHCAFHHEEAVSRAKLAAAPFVFSGMQALLLDAQPSSKLYRRDFLIAEAIRFGSGPLSGWQVALKAALAARQALYFQWAGVDVDQSPQARSQFHARQSAGQLARALDALAATLSAEQAARLPLGWQRRLYARALWAQMYFSTPKRGKPGQVLFAAAAAWAAFRRGQTRYRTPLDPYMGPRIEQLLSLGAILRRSPAPMVAPVLDSSHNPNDITQHPKDFSMLSFAVKKGARFRYKAEFSEFPYANISFYNRDQTHILFHLSLRQEDGLAVCNKRTGDDWGREIPHRLSLPKTGVDVEIVFNPPEIMVLLDGKQIFHFGSGFRRNRFPQSDQISYVDFQGGISPAGIDIDISGVDQTQKDQLSLNSRLELRTRLLSPTPKPQIRLDVPGMSPAPQVIPRPSNDTIRRKDGTFWEVDLRSLLPGRVWDHVAPDQPLMLTLRGADDAPICPPLTLTRAEMAQQIDATLTDMDLITDALAAMQVIEHVRFGGLLDHLSAPARNALATVQRFYGLDDFLLPPEDPDATGTGDMTHPAADPVPPAPLPEPDPVAQAQARFGRTMRANPDTDPLDVLAELDLPKDLRPYLFLGLSEFFSAQGRDYDAFHAQFIAEGYEGFLKPAPGDVWKNSAMLPFLLLEGRYQELRDTLWTLVEPTNDWTVTPAFAWLLRRAIHSPDLPETVREDILYAVMELVNRRIRDYWGRAHCAALTDATAELLIHLDRFADYTRPQITEFALRAYGLSRQFWQMLETHLNGAPVPPELLAAKAAFAVIQRGAQKGRASAELAAALDLFARFGTLDVARLRRELLGPSGLYLSDDAAPDVGALARAGLEPGQAALRHMAFPGAAPVGDDLVQIAAEALPGRYTQVPRAPYYQLQLRTSRMVQNLLEQGATGAAVTPAQIRALAPDLATLASGRSQFLGLGLGLALMRALARDPMHADALRLLLDGVRSFADTLPREKLEPLSDAAAPRLALMAFCTEHAGSDVAQTLCDLLPGVAAHLPETSTVSAENSPDMPGSPLFDTIVTVFSCLPNLTTRIPPMRAGWLGLLRALDIPYVIIVGNGDGRIEGDVVHVDAPDDYEGLPQKTLATIRWVHDNTGFAHLLKIDDDCFLNPDEFFHSLSYRKYDYYGRVLTRHAGQTDRAWHNEKSSSDRGRLELDKSPEPSTYTDGGSGYTLSRTAMAAAIDAMDSPEGQHLIQVSFMEDKLLGDLLALRGIRPVDEDYRIAIRRRTWGKARPVSRWVNSFDASPAAPVKLVHLDAHDTQAAALDTLTKPVLTPKKIWPSYMDVELVYQSNALELISPQDRLDAARAADVAVVACMRNEMFMLPHFLAHYRKLGVGAFLIVDNCSDDGTLEYLLDQPDVALFSVDTDYNLSFYGVAWQQAMMAAFRVGKWSLVADADELLIWQENQTQTLPNLLAGPEFVDKDAARIFMLDMYPKGSLAKATFKTDPFQEAGYVERQPFLSDWTGRGPFSNMPTWTSALRHRLIAGSRTDLFVAQKIALLRYQPWMRVSAGLHFLTDVQLADRELLFAHFKYNADFRRKAQTEVARRQHFNDAEEYRKYLALISEGRDVIYDAGLSVPWTEAPFVKAILSQG